MKMVRAAALSIMAALSFVTLTAAPAQAQATRTWVSGVGDDVNPCSRTAPCKTFAGAISKTSAGGEINCLDPGGYGAVTITKSITIDCEDTQGSILATGTNGVNVNDSASGFPNTIRVILRGLSINGAQTAVQNAQGNPGSGFVGVNFTSGASVTLEQVIIENFNAGNASGVRVSVPAASELYITNSTIYNVGASGTGAGVEIVPGSGGNKSVLDNVFISNSANNGIRLNSATGTINVTVNNSVLSGNANGVVLNAVQVIDLMLTNSTLANNSTGGLFASGANARAIVGNSTITGNGTGVSLSAGATINTYGDNHLNRNTVDGAFTPGAVPKA